MMYLKLLHLLQEVEQRMVETKASFPTKEELEDVLEKHHTKQVQEKLTKAKVAICGLGGLGSNIAIALARTGIGHIHLIDFDVVDLSNLNRQQYAIDHLGEEKAKALCTILKGFAPYSHIFYDCIKVTSENAKKLLEEENIICEAFDVPEQKAMLTNIVLSSMPDKILVGGSGMAGYASANLIQTKKVTDRYYLCGDCISDAKETCGLLAPRVMLCAAHQATMVLRLILGENEA